VNRVIDEAFVRATDAPVLRLASRGAFKCGATGFGVPELNRAARWCGNG
jgi:hypothetical protein